MSAAMNRFRAYEIYQQYTSSSKYRPSIYDFMNEYEIQYVNEVWKRMPDTSSFLDAFLSIVEGDIPLCANGG